MVDFGLYQHHGIACGDGNVIHFGRGIFDLKNAKVERVEITLFCQNRPIKVIESAAEFEPTEILARAIGRMGETGYDLVDNNCEHFVNWCRSGQHSSQQVDLSETIARQSAAAIVKPLIRKWAAKRTTESFGVVATGVTRGSAIVAGVADVIQATAEIAATKQGKSKYESRQIGQQVGGASSAALGWAVGGPTTAVAGFGVWVVGQLIAEQTVETSKVLVRSTAEAVRSNDQ